MTKSELTVKLADTFNLTPRHARIIIDAFFDNILKAIVIEKKLILRGFGTFVLKTSRPRIRRNPQTGENVFVGERKGLTFKAGKSLLSRLNMEKS